MESSTPPPSPPPAGWYPDPEQAQTQRYWTGEEWTDQRAPATATAARSEVNIGVVLALVGSAIAIVGVFLPRLESDTFLQIVDNTLIQSGDGLIAIGLAIAGAIAAYVRRDRPRNWAVIAVGIALAAFAIYAGTGERTELTSANPGDSGNLFRDLDALSRTDEGSPGIGIWAVGVGGLFMAGAGLIGSRRS